MASSWGGFYDNCPVLVTGSTGFKGAWLCRWLLNLGARVTGLALDPPSRPNMFDLLDLSSHLRDIRADVRDLEAVQRAVAQSRPKVIFHLAAQALVRLAHREPLETFGTNVMGTAHVLEAARRCDSIRAVVVVTSDKCYLNDESGRAFKETDPLGGKEPYSASKAAKEMVAQGYLPLLREADGPALATVRAGNIIGGGDWAEDRIVPDLVRALTSGQPLGVRHPEAVRPWQHVLEPLAGYLELGCRLSTGDTETGRAFNFGPPAEAMVTVRRLVETGLEHWPGGRWLDLSQDQAAEPREAGLLCLDSSRAGLELDWRPRLTFSQTVAWTMDWYRDQAAGQDAARLTDRQIEAYAR